MRLQPPSTPFPARTLGGVADLSDVRAEFVAWLATVGVEAERRDDLSVVLSELGANAIRETPDGSLSATVEASVTGNVLEVVVRNEVSVAATSPDDSDWDLDDPLRTGGRGLLLVSAFVDEVEVDVEGRQLIVRCRSSIV